MKRSIALLAGIGLMACHANAQNFQITPFLACVEDGPTPGTIVAWFGYESFEAAIVQVLISSDNRFIPNPASRGQPVLYFPGYHDRAFRVTLDSQLVTQWLFLGNAIPASAESKRCPTGGVTPSLPPGAVGTPYSQQLGAAGGGPSRTWTANGALPPGLLLSTSGELHGTPSAAGQFTVNVQVSDGSTTSARTYSLAIVSSVTVDDAVSTRAPGFSPRLRTVTAPSATPSATATCGANEFAITGGGACTVPNSNTVLGRIATSQPASNGWSITCSGGTATAVAVCSLK